MIGEFTDEEQYLMYKKMVMEDGLLIRFILNKDWELAMLAVHQNPLALEYIVWQTDDLCLLAVRRNGMALKFVANQTLEICLAAAYNNIAALRYVRGDIMLQYHEQFRKLEDVHIAECKRSQQRIVEQTDELVKLAKGINIGNTLERRG